MKIIFNDIELCDEKLKKILNDFSNRFPYKLLICNFTIGVAVKT